MMLALVAALALLSSSSALKCTHNATVTNDVYQRGVLVWSSTSNYQLSPFECSPKLNRCASFKSLDLSFFASLDAGTDNSPFANMVRGGQGKITGKTCMSQADADRIFARKASRCSGSPSPCYCTTDVCA